MNIVHSVFPTPLITKENQIQVLIIENRQFYQNFIKDILLQADGEEGEFAIFDGDKQLKPSKHIDIITDIFNLNINCTKHLNKLYNLIEAQYLKGDGYEAYLRLNAGVLDFAKDVSENLDFEVEFSLQTDIPGLLKNVGLKFTIEPGNLAEEIIDYIRIVQKFIGIKFFVLPGVRSLLSEGQLEDLYSFIHYNKTNVLMLDGHLGKMRLDCEKIRIIDEDLCIID